MIEAYSELIKELQTMTDVNIIVGSPITTKGGSTIIPISNLTVGFLGGFGEYGKTGVFDNKNYPSSQGIGGVVNVKPCGFIIEKDDTIKFVKSQVDSLQNIINSIDELVKNANKK